jgi:hypothetical protein
MLKAPVWLVVLSIVNFILTSLSLSLSIYGITGGGTCPSTCFQQTSNQASYSKPINLKSINLTNNTNLKIQESKLTQLDKDMSDLNTIMNTIT